MKLKISIAIVFLLFLFSSTRIDAFIYQRSEINSCDSTEYKNGKKWFSAYCAVCHGINHKIVGPPLNNIQVKRSVTWIKQYIKNDEVFVKTDSIAKSFRTKPFYINHPNSDTILTEKNVDDILYFIAQESKTTKVKH